MGKTIKLITTSLKQKALLTFLSRGVDPTRKSDTMQI